MCFLAAWLGAESIRFTELQNASDKDFIGADAFFDNLPKDPFTEGCEVTLPNQYGLPLQVIVKVTCGRVNCRKPPVKEQPVRTGVTHVLYPNGEVAHGKLLAHYAGILVIVGLVVVAPRISRVCVPLG